MNIIELKIGDVIPYKNNPRKNDHAVDAVANSIREFGFRVPIIVDRENVVVAGHTRLKAAEKLGLKTVPAIRADDLTEEQIKAFRLADNKVAELAKWDMPKLQEEIENITGYKMFLFGFEHLEAAQIEDFIEEHHGEKEEKTKMITCPYCGASFDALKADRGEG